MGDPIGSGAFGCVLKVKDLNDKKIKALKVYSQALDETLDEVRNEYDMLCTLKDIEQVVKVEKYFKIEDMICMLMEFIDGINLSQFIRLHFTERVLDENNNMV